MITVVKEFTFDAAHMLSGHNGLCKNIHGHTYKVQVHISKDESTTEVEGEGSSAGMVMDFKDMKNSLNALLFDKLDHAFIYDGSVMNHNKAKAGTEKTLIRIMEIHGLKLYKMPNRPTAENMAKHFYEQIANYFIINYPQVKVNKIVVWETPTSFAEYKL